MNDYYEPICHICRKDEAPPIKIKIKTPQEVNTDFTTSYEENSVPASEPMVQEFSIPRITDIFSVSETPTSQQTPQSYSLSSKNEDINAMPETEQA